MSNFLAIATVTATLRQTLQNILDSEMPAPVPGARVITARPEDLAGTTTDPRINIYLYQVTPNAAWRNADLPTRRSDGAVVQRPQVALDLHYLLSCYGDETRLEPQRLLGIITRTMHAQPVLTRQAISNAIDALIRTDRGTFDFLSESNLADAVELVKFSPLHLSLEELSKIWSVFYQVQYALSVAYQGTVVLIESDDVPQKALPVRDRTISVVPFHPPVIEQVISQTEANQPKTGGPQPIFAISTLVIVGQRLRGDPTPVQVGGTSVPREITLLRIGGSDVPPLPQNVSDKQISLDLSTVPNLQAGVQGVQVIHQMLLGIPPVRHPVGAESNLAAFVLHPIIQQQSDGTYEITVANVQGGGNNPRSADVTVKVNPPVGKTQRVILLLNEFNPNLDPKQPFDPSAPPARAYSFNAPSRNQSGAPDTTDTITILITGVMAGPYLVRVQVDGAESPLSADANGQYNAPPVVIP